MNRKALWAVILCLLLVLCAGCVQQDPPETTPPTTAPAETEPPATTVAADPVETYNKAFEALGSDAVKMSVKLTQTVTVAGQTFQTNSDLFLNLWNLGTPEFSARVKQTNDMGQHLYMIDELFSQGKVWQTVTSGKYTADMEAEDFLARYPAPQLLDASLYTLALDTNGIRFTEATALEAWLGGEDAELISAEGYLTLNAQELPEQFTFQAEYNYGPGHFVVSYDITYSASTQQPELPSNEADYAALKDIDSVWLMETAYGYLLQAKQYSSSVLNNIQSQAAGFLMNKQQSVDTFVKEAGTDYRFETSTYYMDVSGTYQQDVSEKFLDGKFTASIDGGEYAPDASVTAPVIQSAAETILIGNIWDSNIFTGGEISNLGSLLLVEYQVGEDIAKSIQQNIYGTYFGSPSLLDDLATGYKTNKLELYLALDSYTLLPTAAGYLYEGAHTIDGSEYLTLEQVDQSFDLASLTSHNTIYEEPAPDAQPEVAPTPLFYRVTGDNGQQMWLFGTIHVGDDRTGFLPTTITDALIASDALAVECDTKGFEKQVEEDEELQAQVSQLYYYTDGPVSDHLDTEDLYEDAKKVMRATGSYFYNSDYMKASLWSNNISNYYLSQGHQLISEKGIESRLEKIAEENNVPLWEVESSLFQIEMMTGYSDYLQEFELYSAVYSHGAENWESTAELYELWCAGDEAALIEELAREPWIITEEDIAEWEAEEELEPEDLEDIAYVKANLETINEELDKIYWEYTNAMEVNRNANMLKVAQEYLESGKTVFYAVGLAHLLAEDGLVNTLRDAGYTVELVSFS